MIVRADAFRLPFRDESFDVVVADPPYEVSNPHLKHLIPRTPREMPDGRKLLREVGYIEFRGREWWQEAWRVLSADGHLYVFVAIKELRAWYGDGRAAPHDIISWVQPNARGIQARIRRVIGGRTVAWRPILHWRRGRMLSWALPDRTGTGYVEPNYFIESQVQANMAEALPWPNQLPIRLLLWLLGPHRGARVLDLFSGTGTCREAALSLGLQVVSVELSPEALAIIRRRPAQLPLLGPGPPGPGPRVLR